MGMKPTLSLSAQQRRYLAWLLTAALHGWLLYCLLHYRPLVPQRTKSEQWSVLWLLTTPPSEQPQAPQAVVTDRNQSAIKRPRSSSSSPASPKVAPEANTAITIQPQERADQASKPTIDWDAAATDSTKELAGKLDAKPSQRALDGSDKKESAKPKKQSEFDWRPETKRFGVTEHGLPYIRLNRRCVYLPPYILGCGLGKLPPPNRDLFKGMDDPDEVRDSVPDVAK